MSEQPVLKFPDGEGWKDGLAVSLERLRPIIETHIDKQMVAKLSRGALAQQIRMIVSKNAPGVGLDLNLLQERDLVTTLVTALAGPAPEAQRQPVQAPPPRPNGNGNAQPNGTPAAAPAPANGVTSLEVTNGANAVDDGMPATDCRSAPPA